MRWLSALQKASALIEIGVCVIPQHPPFSLKEEALPVCKETITKDTVVLKGPSIQMYYKEKLTKNLADLNTFETSMSLRDRVKSYLNLTPLSIYIHTYSPQVAQRC